MRRIGFIVILALVFLSLVSCKQDGQTDATPISLSAIEQSNKSNPEKAELLAQAAEKIVLGPNFMDADKILDRALALDPSNVRAQVYKAALAPAMLSKGIMTRVAPLIPQLDADDQALFKMDVDYLKTQLPNSPATAFWFDGQPDIRNENDIQNYVAQLQVAMHTAEDMFAKLRDASDIHIILRPVNFSDQNQSTANTFKNCSATLSNDVLTPYSCEGAFDQEWKMDYPDWEGLRLAFAAYEYNYLAWNAYNGTGAYTVYSRQKSGKLSDKEKIELIHEQRDLGHVRDADTLKRIYEMGTEGIQFFKTAAQKQSDWCSSGTMADNARPDALFSYGVCADGTTQAWTNLIDRVLTGPTALTFRVFSEFGNRRWQSGRYRTTVNVKPFFDGDLVNLQDILPTIFDAKGKALNLPDGTLKGLAPTGDAVKIIRSQYPYVFRSNP